MQSTVGPVKSVQMSYNAQGKTTGVATVLFRNKGDAHKAHASCESISAVLGLRGRGQGMQDRSGGTRRKCERPSLTPDNNRMIDNR